VRRHWKKLALLLGAALAACILFALFSGQPEPSYQGRSLTQWVVSHTNHVMPITRIFGRTGEFRWARPVDEAETDALLHMGTNVFPFLTEWAVAAPPKWRKPLDFICVKLPSLKKNSLLASLFQTADRQTGAARAFHLLRTNAAPALPQLARIAANTQNTNQAAQAVQTIDNILVCFPPEAFLNHPDPIIREQATNMNAFILWLHFLPRP
jgi:hypothetical protein